MLNWYYKYIRGGKTVREAVSTPSVPGLTFAMVRDQLIIPHLCARGISGFEEDYIEEAKNAPDIEPLPASDIADSLTVNGMRYSLGTGYVHKIAAADPEKCGLVLRRVTREYLHDATAIWNEIVAAGESFPGDELLSDEQAWEMFEEQTSSVCALDGDEVVGVYILHPNNIGRCGHIANASYAVKAGARGRGVGRALVEDCLCQAKAHGFRGLQFNAVVSTNTAALKLYIKLGFRVIGTVPGGYRYKDESYRDTLIMIKTWEDMH